MMRIFHMDMNSAKYNQAYLRRILPVLRSFDFDAIVWELEDSVRFETCPAAASPDSISKETMYKILQYSSSLGFTNIPLLQSVSHCAYILRCEEYEYLSEHPKFLELYCLTRPEIRNFLLRLIDEYLTLFDGCKYFHLGADEAWAIGRFCDECRDAVKKEGAGRLLANHLSKLCNSLLSKDIRPVIWADMIHKYPDMTGFLDKRIVMADWHYGSPEQECVASLPGHRIRPPKDPFCASAYLCEQGFTVWGCASARSYGDSVFAPRYELHVTNYHHWLEIARKTPLDGVMLTSWSVHLFPFELQIPIIARGFYPLEDDDDFENSFIRDFFGLSENSFFRAIRLISEPVWFSTTSELGYNQVIQHAPADTLEKTLRRYSASERRVGYENAYRRLRDYSMAENIFIELNSKVIRNRDIFLFWELAAKQLVFRAELAIFAFSASEDENERKRLKNKAIYLRSLLEEKYRGILLKNSCESVMDNIFGTVEFFLEKHSENQPMHHPESIGVL